MITELGNRKIQSEPKGSRQGGLRMGWFGMSRLVNFLLLNGFDFDFEAARMAAGGRHVIDLMSGKGAAIRYGYREKMVLKYQ